jgi:uncharacterized protein with PQ loop repeat
MEEYPHPDKVKRFVDKLVYFASIMGVLMTLPQIWLIYVGRNASGLSIISYCSYLVIGLIWLYYGILHKAKPIILVNTIWFFLYIAIIVGIVLYG